MCLYSISKCKRVRVKSAPSPSNPQINLTCSMCLVSLCNFAPTSITLVFTQRSLTVQMLFVLSSVLISASLAHSRRSHIDRSQVYNWVQGRAGGDGGYSFRPTRPSAICRKPKTPETPGWPLCKRAKMF